VPLDEGPNVLFELAGGGVDTSAQLFAGEFGEPAFDLVDPRCRRRREVDVVVRPTRKPCPDRRGLVGGVIDGVDAPSRHRCVPKWCR